MENYAIIYLTVINILSMIMIIVDKILAKKNKFRFSEKLLLVFASIGGALAMYVMMRLVKHKTKDISFMKIFYLIFIVWLGLTIVLLI